MGKDPDRNKDGVYINPQGNDTNPLAFRRMDTTDAYHIYQLVSKPECQDRVQLYVDGIEYNAFNYQGTPMEFGFGSGRVPDRGEANWSLVTFETGVHIVPEPTTLAVLAVSTVFLRRRK